MLLTPDWQEIRKDPLFEQWLMDVASWSPVTILRIVHELSLWSGTRWSWDRILFEPSSL